MFFSISQQLDRRFLCIPSQEVVEVVNESVRLLSPSRADRSKDIPILLQLELPDVVSDLDPVVVDIVGLELPEGVQLFLIDGRDVPVDDPRDRLGAGWRGQRALVLEEEVPIVRQDVIQQDRLPLQGRIGPLLLHLVQSVQQGLHIRVILVRGMEDAGQDDQAILVIRCLADVTPVLAVCHDVVHLYYIGNVLIAINDGDYFFSTRLTSRAYRCPSIACSDPWVSSSSQWK